MTYPLIDETKIYGLVVNIFAFHECSVGLNPHLATVQGSMAHGYRVQNHFHTKVIYLYRQEQQ